MASQPKQTKSEPIDLAAIIAGTERRGGQPYKVVLLLDMLPDEYRATLEDVLSKPQIAAWSDRRIADIFNDLLAALDINDTISAAAIHNYRQGLRG